MDIAFLNSLKFVFTLEKKIAPKICVVFSVMDPDARSTSKNGGGYKPILRNEAIGVPDGDGLRDIFFKKKKKNGCNRCILRQRVRFFFAPEPKAQVHYCDHVLSVVCRPSSLTFHIFDFSSETAEQNLTKLYRKVDLNVLYQVCVFRADRKNKMAALASDWPETFSTSPLKPLNGIQRNLIGSKITTSSTKFVFFGPIEKTRWPLWPLIG